MRNGLMDSSQTLRIRNLCVAETVLILTGKWFKCTTLGRSLDFCKTIPDHKICTAYTPIVSSVLSLGPAAARVKILSLFHGQLKHFFLHQTFINFLEYQTPSGDPRHYWSRHVGYTLVLPWHFYRCHNRLKSLLDSTFFLKPQILKLRILNPFPDSSKGTHPYHPKDKPIAIGLTTWSQFVCPANQHLESTIKKKAHKPLRIMWISPKMCLPCLIIIQSCYSDYRMNNLFACSRCVICVSCSVHMISTYYVRKGSWAILS